MLVVEWIEGKREGLLYHRARRGRLQIMYFGEEERL